LTFIAITPITANPDSDSNARNRPTWSKYRWNQPVLKLYSRNLSPQELNYTIAALEVWLDPKHSPINRGKNKGDSKNVMDEGPKWFGKGKISRSLSASKDPDDDWSDLNRLADKYTKKPHVTKPKDWEWGSAQDYDIRVEWRRLNSSAKGRMRVKKKRKLDYTGETIIVLNSRYRNEMYFVRNTDGDGYYTNKDGPCPGCQYDFYTIILHELGHTMCLEHSSGSPKRKSRKPKIENEHRFSSGILSEESDEGIAGSGMVLSNSRFDTILYFASDRTGGYGGFDIYQMTFDEEDSIWNQPVNLGPPINTEYNERDPFVGIDQSSIIFVSDRPGGVGGYDVFESSFDLLTKEWSEPIGLGEEINSPWNERNPCTDNGEWLLWFSSDRPSGYGDYDIWVSEWDLSSGWMSAFNLEEPYNTQWLEMVSCIDDRSSILYFATSRPWTRQLDIWTMYLDVDTGFPTAIDSTTLSNINSEYNEIDPCVDPFGNVFYFSSNRPGGVGGFDLFQGIIAIPWVSVCSNVSVSGHSGATFRVGYSIVNNGIIAAEYMSEVTDNEGWTIDPNVFNISLISGERLEFLVSVAAPSGTTIGEIDTVVLTATAMDDSNAIDSDWLTIEIDQPEAFISVVLDPDTTNVSRGDSLSFVVTMTNEGAEVESLYAWAEVKKTHEHPLRNNIVVVDPVKIILEPGITYESRYSHLIDEDIPLGEFEFNGLIGNYPYEIVASDSFIFNVIE
jgi:hypothetical protein